MIHINYNFTPRTYLINQETNEVNDSQYYFNNIDINCQPYVKKTTIQNNMNFKVLNYSGIVI